MFCSNCGNEISEKDKFCTNCGQANEFSDSTQNQEKSDNKTWRKRMYSLSKLSFIICITAFIAIVLLHNIIPPHISFTILALSGITGMICFFIGATIEWFSKRYICPNCNSYLSLDCIHSVETGRKRSTKIKTTQTTHYRGYFKSSSDVVGRSVTKTSVPTEVIYYHRTYKCNQCGHITERDVCVEHEI